MDEAQREPQDSMNGKTHPFAVSPYPHPHPGEATPVGKRRGVFHFREFLLGLPVTGGPRPPHEEKMQILMQNLTKPPLNI